MTIYKFYAEKTGSKNKLMLLSSPMQKEETIKNYNRKKSKRCPKRKLEVK